MPKTLVPSSADDAFRRLSALCASSEQAPADLLRKMQTWNMAPEAQAAVMERLQKGKFFDEERYALAFVSDKLKYNGWGRIRLRHELRHKGIASSAIAHALEAIDETLYRERLRSILSSKLRSEQGKAQNAYALKGKLLRFASGRGFEQQLVMDLVDDLSPDEFSDF
ncbi:MAG: RecX family transcriptional regulator [Bacteroidaceae bacterium]|nr:RecX family transcriptional regulator [Bacteroidaceae bacterium]